MKHHVKLNRLSRTSAHRKAMLRNAIHSLLLHEQIHTTKAKAQEIQRYTEKLITKASANTLHSWRYLQSYFQNKNIVSKLINEIAPRFANTKGGYVRVISLANRRGDNAEIVLCELTVRAPRSTQDEKNAKGSSRDKRDKNTKSLRRHAASARS